MKYIVSALLIVALLGRFYGYYETLPDYEKNPTIQTMVTLQESPEMSNKGQRFSIKDSHNQTIFVTTAVTPQYHTGQVLRIDGTVRVSKNEKYNGLVSISYPKIRVISDSASVFVHVANVFREKSKILYDRSLPPVSASLLAGIVFGAKEQFPDDFLASLRNTGVMHIVAASGMNIAFVAGGCVFVFGRILRRQYAIILASIGVVFYVFMVGMQPSIIRAGIMGLLAFGAVLTGRQQFAFWAVLVSGYGMLVYQPGYLFDLGFQLSFMATLGIICLQPIVPFPKKLFFEVLSTTLSAQIATVPLLLSMFGTVGMYSLLVNMLILWIIPIVMILGTAGAIVGLISTVVGQSILLLSLPLFLYAEWIISYFGNMGGVMQVSLFPWQFIVAYYLFLIAIVVHKHTWKGKVMEIVK